MSRKKYEPKLKDRVRVAWATEESREMVGHTGVVCGVTDGYATAIELDAEVYGQWIFACHGGDFRLEPYDA